jgi:hypothetical protein
MTWNYDPKAVRGPRSEVGKGRRGPVELLRKNPPAAPHHPSFPDYDKDATAGAR